MARGVVWVKLCYGPCVVGVALSVWACLAACLVGVASGVRAWFGSLCGRGFMRVWVWVCLGAWSGLLCVRVFGGRGFWHEGVVRAALLWGGFGGRGLGRVGVAEGVDWLGSLERCPGGRGFGCEGVVSVCLVGVALTVS